MATRIFTGELTTESTGATHTATTTAVNFTEALDNFGEVWKKIKPSTVVITDSDTGERKSYTFAEIKKILKI